MATTWYQIGPLLARQANIYKWIGPLNADGAPDMRFLNRNSDFEPPGKDGPTGYRAGDKIDPFLAFDNPFVHGWGTRINKGEWTNYGFPPYDYNKIDSKIRPQLQKTDNYFIWEVFLEFDIQPGDDGSNVVVVRPPTPTPAPGVPVTASAAETFDAGRVIPYSKGARRIDGVTIWTPGVEGGEAITTDQAFASWADAYGYPLQTEAIQVETVWFNGNKAWTRTDGVVLEGLSDLLFRFYDGADDQLPDAAIVADKGANRTSGNPGLIYIVFLNVSLAAVSNRRPSTAVEFTRVDGERISVSGVLTNVGEIGIPEVSVEVIGVEDEADGVVFDGLAPRSTFATYAEQYDYRIKDGDPVQLIHRAVNEDLEIDIELTAEDFADESADDDVVPLERADDSNLPGSVELTYQDKSRDYQKSGPQVARLPTFPFSLASSNAPAQKTTEFIITAEEALGLAYDMLYRSRAERLASPFKLIPERGEIEEADVISVPTGQGTFVMQVTSRTLNPDKSIEIEAKYLLAERGANLTADSGDTTTGLRAAEYYPQVLWKGSYLGSVFTSPADIAVTSDGKIAAISTPEFAIEALSIASTNIPSRLSVRNFAEVDHVWLLQTPAISVLASDESYFYAVGTTEAAGAGNVFVYRVSRADYSDVTTLDTGITHALPQAAVCASDGAFYIACSGRVGTPGDDPVLIRVDTAAFSGATSDTLSGITGTSQKQALGLCATRDYVVATAVGFNGSDTNQKVYCKRLSDGTLTDAAIDVPLGGGIGTDDRAYFLPATALYPNDLDAFDYTNTTGARIDPVAIDVTYFDVTDDANVHIVTAGAKPWSDGTHLCFLANNTGQLNADNIYVPAYYNAPFLARRSLDDLSVVDGRDLTFDFDNTRYQLGAGACDSNWHYLRGQAIAGHPLHGDGCILKVSIPLTASLFYPPNRAAPVNDNFPGTAIVVGTSQSFNNELATKQTDEPDHAGNAGGKSLWWTFTAPADGIYKARVTFPTTGNRHEVAVYKGNSLPALVEAASYVSNAAGDPQDLSFYAFEGEKYRIAFDGYFDSDAQTTWFSPGSILLSLVSSAPTNDNFANALSISAGQTKTAKNRFATKESGEPNHAGNAGGKSVWYKFVATADTNIRFSTSGSDFPTLLGVYTGSAVNALTEIDSDADSGGTDDDYAAWTAA